jgi:hypothetical protein
MKSLWSILIGLMLLTSVAHGRSLTGPDADQPRAKGTRAVKKRPPLPAARSRVAVPPAPRATDPQSSQRAVCQSQCNLQRMSCDQARAPGFQDRADQLQAAQASCYLAVNSCLSRC